VTAASAPLAAARPADRVAAADLKIPPALPGMTIGLLGGSFNPPHAGHAHVAETALERLGLDRMWVMVTPGNPLKERQGLPSMARRIAATRALMRDPRIVVTGFEKTLGSAYSWMTVRRLARSYPRVRFVWIMGADNLLQFDRWRDWDQIARTTSIAVVDRPGATFRAMGAKAAQRFAAARVAERDAPLLADRRPPAFVFLHGPRIAQSSTALRALKARGA
jgi:nicotinate-nucleotide adenylyltransferase